MGHGVQQNVPNAFHHRIRLLALVQRITQSSVDGDDVVNVPEYLLQEVSATWLWDDILILQPVDPSLFPMIRHQDTGRYQGVGGSNSHLGDIPYHGQSRVQCR